MILDESTLTHLPQHKVYIAPLF